MLSSTSLNLLVRVSPPRRLVLPSGTRTVSPKCDLLRVTRYYVSSSLRVRHLSQLFTNALRFLNFELGLAPQIPEDLWHLVKKAVAVRKHLETNRKDKDSKFRLILIESRIHRLARYYKSKQQIPPSFKYDSATASTLIA